MSLLPVYSLMDIELVRGAGSVVTDANGIDYIDLYGGHAVITIGHCHPHYVAAVQQQVAQLGFYSNSVHIGVQEQLAVELANASGYPDYRWFMVNSGAEANENALKLASFATGRSAVVAMRGAFHGRTSLAVAATDNPKIQAPVNRCHDVTFLPLDDATAVAERLAQGDVAAVIIEGIQGVGGVYEASAHTLRAIERACTDTGTMLVLDEVQSGMGRTGTFFAHQVAGIQPHIITMAKGLGNGFPVGGILVHPDVAVWDGMLGTTFGGNHLACAAALATLHVVQRDNLVAEAARKGAYLIDAVRGIAGVTAVRGRGLMIGIDTVVPSSVARAHLVRHHRMLTGNASTPNTVRVLPALTIDDALLQQFVEALTHTLAELAS